MIHINKELAVNMFIYVKVYTQFVLVIFLSLSEP